MIAFYFDFISPYSYLASQLVEREGLEVSYRPVVFGSMLSHLETKGPGEIPVKRRASLQDILLLASYHDIPLVGPPTHPFNSVYALRSIAAAPEAKRRALVGEYFRAAWAQGLALDDLSVLKRCLDKVGIDQDPEDAATTRANREAVKGFTKELLDAGGYGVPTFVADGLLFFGHDRLPVLRAYLQGKLTFSPAQLEAMLARPQPGRLST